jgi:hypothetical protein
MRAPVPSRARPQRLVRMRLENPHQTTTLPLGSTRFETHSAIEPLYGLDCALRVLCGYGVGLHVGQKVLCGEPESALILGEIFLMSLR